MFRRFGFWWGGVCTAAALLAAGCGGSGGGGEPIASGPVDFKLPKISPASRNNEGGKPRIAMILPEVLGPRARVWEQSARLEASRLEALYDSFRMEEGVDQPALVRRAVRTGATALIVVPEDPDEVAPAVLEARQKGVPALTIVEPLPVGDEVEPVPTVIRPSYVPSAHGLVEALVEDAPLIGRSPEGPALVIYKPGEQEVDLRLEALRIALEEAEIPLFGGEPMAMPGRVSETTERLEELVGENPGLPMVLCVDDRTFRAAVSARHNLPPDERFVVAGYAGEHALLDTIDEALASAAAYCDDVVLGYYALRNAIALSQNEPVPDWVEVPLPVKRSNKPPNSSVSPSVFRNMRPTAKARKYVPGLVEDAPPAKADTDTDTEAPSETKRDPDPNL